jgi:hypothetical protein
VVQDLTADPAADALRRRRGLQRGGFAVLAVGALGFAIWGWSRREPPRKGWEVRGLGVAVIASQAGESADHVADFLAAPGFEVQHGTLEQWGRILGSDATDLGSVLQGAAADKVAFALIEHPAGRDLDDLAAVVGPVSAPADARWWALSLGSLDGAGATATWSPSPSRWEVGGAVGALDALLQQPALQTRPSSRSARGNAELAGFNARIRVAREHLATAQAMDAKAEAITTEIADSAGLELGEGAALAVPSGRSGHAVPIDGAHWVSLSRELQVTHDGSDISVRRSGMAMLHLAGLARAPTPVMGEDGEPFLAPAEATLRSGSSGTVLFVVAPTGAKRAFMIEHDRRGPHLRLGARFERPTRDERASLATNTAGDLVRTIDDRHAGWLRVHRQAGGTVDLAPIPGEALGTSQWLDDTTLVVTGRVREGTRADRVWVYAADGESAPVGLSSRDFGVSSTASRLDALRVVGPDLLYVDRHRSRGRSGLLVSVRREPDGTVTGVGRVVVLDDGPRADSLSVSGDASRACQVHPGRGLSCFEPEARRFGPATQVPAAFLGESTVISRTGELAASSFERHISGVGEVELSAVIPLPR